VGEWVGGGSRMGPRTSWIVASPHEGACEGCSKACPQQFRGMARLCTGWAVGRRSAACRKTPLEELIDLVVRLPVNTKAWMSLLLSFLDYECACFCPSSYPTEPSRCHLMAAARSRMALFLALANGSSHSASAMLAEQEDNKCESGPACTCVPPCEQAPPCPPSVAL
jgi:hypothetical protein